VESSVPQGPFHCGFTGIPAARKLDQVHPISAADVKQWIIGIPTPDLKAERSDGLFPALPVGERCSAEMSDLALSMNAKSRPNADL
jgi:hypothetical protein